MNHRITLLTLATLSIAACAPATPPSAPEAPVPTQEEQVPPPLPTEEEKDVIEEPDTRAMEKVEKEVPDLDGASSSASSMERSSVEAPAKRVIPVTADNWLFSPAMITVKKGETVEVELMGAGGTHGFSIPELGINVPIAVGETKMVEIPTDRAGTFAGSCSIPCGSGHTSMQVTVVVEE